MKFYFNQLKISTKFMLVSSILIVTVVLTISFFVNKKIEQLTEEKVSTFTQKSAISYAAVVDSFLEEALNNSKLLAQMFALFAENKKLNFTREDANLFLKDFIEKHPEYVGVCVVFEPNAFDGRDADFINAPGHDATGRFVPYWTLNAQKSGVVEAVIGYQTEDWYLYPKRSLQPEVIEPYEYNVQNKPVLMTSLVVPILGKNGQFLGIASIDLSIENFAKHFEKINIDGFNDAYVAVYSKTGILVGTSRSGIRHNLGKTLEEIGVDQAYIDHLMQYRDFFLERNSVLLGESILTFGYPIEIGDKNSYWMATVNIPIREIQEQSQVAFFAIMLIGFFGVVLALFSIYLLTRRILKPLRQVNEHLYWLSQGQPNQCQDIAYIGKDEVAELVNYAHQLKYSMLDTIHQAKAIAGGDYNNEIKLLSEKDELGLALSNMLLNLREAVKLTQEQDWLKTGQTELNTKLSGEQNLVALAENIINYLVPYLGGQVGAIYLIYDEKTDQPYLKMVASHAYVWRKHAKHEFKIGEGLIGQAALERKIFVIAQPPDDYLYVQTGLGGGCPKHIVVTPFLYEGDLKGVLEIATLSSFTSLQLEFLNQVSNGIAIAMHSATSRTVMAALLEQTQLQAQEMEQQTRLLQSQQSELQQANEELQSQSEELQTQQEELRQANEELQSRTVELERQRMAVQDKNKVLESARIAIETKAKELELASRYKSEFLANMSHELRTPLNSLLILAQLLVRNAEGNLTEKQLEYAKTIHGAGADLLTLINEILDLSKVEAGRIEINREPCPIDELLASIDQKFRHVAEEKNLPFKVVREAHVPDVVHTDGQRLKQIINNLLSNAFKFTEQGQVTLTLSRPTAHFLREKQCNLSDDYLMISVNDTGIGVPKEKQAIIFEAFQQADGTTSRRYGGTGLGLAISRQLARLLGGDLFLSSEVNVGSTFTFLFSLNLNSNSKKSTFLPEQSILNQTLNDLNQISNASLSPSIKTNQDNGRSKNAMVSPKEKAEMPDKLYDDRDILHHNDKTLLIMEDDRVFANMLVELAHEKGFKCIRAEDGNTGLELVQRYKPDAIILDVGLPRIDGLTVLERLKDDADTRHIPVHFISGADQASNAKRMGAMGYLLKPVNMGELTQAFEKLSEVIEQVIKHLLLVVDNAQHQTAIVNVIADNDVECTMCHTLDAAIAKLKQPNHIQFDAIVLDIDVENAQGLNLLSQLVKNEEWAQIPVILYANRNLTETEEQTLKHFEDSLTVKSVASPERLLDEATLFMHQIANTLSEEKQQMLRMVHDKEAILAHKKVLLVDDDMRNTFALMTVLEDKDMEVSIANNGIEALALLKQKKEIDLILMDIMMPEMDGYATMQAIRKQQEFRKLPIIALTAKAMKDDKVKCIEAGANDYLTKPVDIDKLLSLMRVWLYK